MENLEKLNNEGVSWDLFIEGPGSYIFIETDEVKFKTNA